MAAMLTDNLSGTKHRDVGPSEILKSQKYVTKAQETVESFISHFLIDDKAMLIRLSSEASTMKAIETDVLS